VHTCRRRSVKKSEVWSEDVWLNWSGCGLQCQVSVCQCMLRLLAEVHMSRGQHLQMLQLCLAGVVAVASFRTAQPLVPCWQHRVGRTPECFVWRWLHNQDAACICGCGQPSKGHWPLQLARRNKASHCHGGGSSGACTHVQVCFCMCRTRAPRGGTVQPAPVPMQLSLGSPGSKRSTA
jgi:hypothetical protein